MRAKMGMVLWQGMEKESNRLGKGADAPLCNKMLYRGAEKIKN